MQILKYLKTLESMAVDAIVNAAKIAICEVNAFLVIHPEMEVTFCCFSKWDAEVYETLLRDRGEH